MSKTKAENHQVSTESPHRYFHMMLNMAEDDLDPYEYRLLGHFIRQTGHGGMYEVGIRAIAKHTKMSVNRVRKAREELARQGYLEVTIPTQEEQQSGQPVMVKVIDRWNENIQRYSRGGCVKSDTGGVLNLTQVETKGVSNLTQGGVLNLTPLEEQLPIEEQLQKQKDFSPSGENPLFSTIEERYGVGVGDDWLVAYWEQNDIKPKRPRPCNPVFDAISEHVFEIPDTSVLDKKEAARVGKHAAIAKEAFRLCIGDEEDAVLAIAIGAHKKTMQLESNGFKKPSLYPDPYKTEFKAYLLRENIKEAILRRIHQERHPKVVEVDDSPIISEEEQQRNAERFQELVASKSGNGKIAA